MPKQGVKCRLTKREHKVLTLESKLQGKSVYAILRRMAIRDMWIARQRGQALPPLPEPKRSGKENLVDYVMFFLPPSKAAKFKALCEHNGKTISRRLREYVAAIQEASGKNSMYWTKRFKVVRRRKDFYSKTLKLRF